MTLNVDEAVQQERRTFIFNTFRGHVLFWGFFPFVFYIFKSYYTPDNLVCLPQGLFISEEGNNEKKITVATISTKFILTQRMPEAEFWSTGMYCGECL